MSDLGATSGPWLGWSIQYGIRIGEQMKLHITDGRVEGTGMDKDGDFEVVGTFGSGPQGISMTRRYSRTNEPSQAGVGIPYLYVGTWDGSIAYGTWCPLLNPHSDGGPFEMWPASEKLSLSMAVEDEVTLVVPSRGL
ncbi:MAG: hypothetical protein K8R88_10135 [Armatimonadetes bacterium]|nr:hypothetical protein [Armatimonadota bacterium]